MQEKALEELRQESEAWKAEALTREQVAATTGTKNRGKCHARVQAEGACGSVGGGAVQAKIDLKFSSSGGRVTRQAASSSRTKPRLERPMMEVMQVVGAVQVCLRTLALFL